MKYITLCGMSRSGNHAIIRWLMPHYEQAGFRVHFYNNATKDFLEHVKFLMEEKDEKVKKVFIVSLEDYNSEMDGRLDSLTRVADLNILLLRDPLNLFASRIAGLGPNRGVFLGAGKFSDYEKMIAETSTFKGLPGQAELYLNHWREYSGVTNLLRNKECILYNQWLKDSSYRKAIIDRLGLNFTDDGYNVRADSSFGSANFSEEDYLQRWKRLWDLPIFAPIRNNPELIKISESFGVSPE